MPPSEADLSVLGKTVEGHFEPQKLGDEAGSAGFEGAGSITLVADGVWITAQHRRPFILAWMSLLGLLVGGVVGVVIGSATESRAAGVAVLVVLSAVCFGYGVRERKPKPFKAVIPWASITRPVIVDNILTFKLHRGSPRGSVRFKGPEDAVTALRPHVTEMQRRIKG